MICFHLRWAEIRIEFGFVAVCALLCTMGEGNILYGSLLAVMLHECAHLIAMMLFGMKLKSITLHGCGIRICPEPELHGYGQELAVLLAGPLCNIAVWFILRCFTGNAALAEYQLVLGLLNLLPCRRLDGGAALCCIISMTRLCPADAERILRCIFVFVPVLIGTAGFFAGITNFTYYALLCYLLLSEFSR